MLLASWLADFLASFALLTVCSQFEHVQVMSKALQEHGYYKKKGVVRRVKDKFVGEIEMLDSGKRTEGEGLTERRAVRQGGLGREGGVFMPCHALNVLHERLAGCTWWSRACP